MYMKIKSAVFSRVLSDEMASRHRRMKQLEARRREEIYTKIPVIASLDRDSRSLAFDFGKRILSGEEQDGILDAASSLIASHEAERTQLLEANGYPADYLEPQYVCSECRDTGRIGGELCRCVYQLAIDTVFEDSGIDPNASFENFDLSLQRSPANRSSMARIRDAAIAYADNFPDNEKRDLVYYGMTGVGKTYLINCIGCRLLTRGYSVLKISAGRLIDITMQTLRADESEKPDFILPDLLIIDDLGTEPMINNITIETLLSILCRRQDQNKATVIASNLAIADMGNRGEPADKQQLRSETISSRYGERFASRLMAPRTSKLQWIQTENVRLMR